ncbi:MAG TPA: PAS domain-containing sensor histidine kinase [Candidatus Limnocylindrales bacterium]
MTIETRGAAPANRGESAFRGFFESVAVGAVQLSPDGHFLEVNERFCALTGYPREDLLRMRVADLDHPDDRAVDQARWDQFLRDPDIRYEAEKRYVRRDGGTIWVHVTAAVIRYGGARPLIAKTVEDITERVRASEVLRDREERLRQALAVKEEFLGLVSHELRTPLTVIVGLADVMARRSLPPHVLQETARELRESSEQLATLLESMLVLARVDREDERSIEPLRLATVVGRVVERHRDVLPGRRFGFEDRAPAGLVEGHEAWISQVVGNLLSNAEKYSPPAGEVCVVVERVERELVVRVLDEGPGVADEDLPLIFDPFYRAAHARAESGGLGLGLAVCRRLVELQGGRIWAARRPAGGSEFAFALPVLEAPDDGLTVLARPGRAA